MEIAILSSLAPRPPALDGAPGVLVLASREHAQHVRGPKPLGGVNDTGARSLGSRVTSAVTAAAVTPAPAIVVAAVSTILMREFANNQTK
jgi:hypothetical protein